MTPTEEIRRTRAFHAWCRSNGERYQCLLSYRDFLRHSRADRNRMRRSEYPRVPRAYSSTNHGTWGRR